MKNSQRNIVFCLVILVAGAFVAQRVLASPAGNSDHFNRTIWTALGVHRINVQRDYGTLALLKLGNELLPNTPPEELDRVRKMLNSAHLKYRSEVESSHGKTRSQSTPVEAAKTALSLAWTVFSKEPKLVVGAELLKNSLEWGRRLYDSHRAPNEQIESQASLRSQQINLQTEAVKILEAAWSLARRNPAYASVIDDLTIAQFGGSVRQDAMTLIKNNPDFADHQALARMIAGWNPDGSVRLTTEEFQTLVHEAISGLRGEIKDAIQQMVQQRNASSQSLRLRGPTYEDTIASTRSAVYSISTLIGFSNPELGRRIFGIGSSSIDALDSIYRFNDAIHGANALSSAMSSMVLTGNLVGVAMNLASLFSGGPTTDQMILNELHELRKDVDQLGKEMHERFDRIDSALNSIYNEMTRSFESLSFQVAAGRSDLSGVQKQLIRLQSQLNAAERKNYQFVEAGFKRTLVAYESLCLEDPQTSRNGKLLLRTLKEKCIPAFRDHGTIVSKDRLSSHDRFSFIERADETTFSSSLMNELAYPIETNYKLLSKVAASRFGVSEMSKFFDAANPIEWARGATDYIRLVTSNWSRLGRILPIEQTQALIDVGHELAAYAKTLSSNESLFSSLIEAYRSKSEKVDQLIRQKRDERFSKRSLGGFPMTEEPAQSDGGYVPPSNLNFDYNRVGSGNEMNLPPGLVLRGFPEFLSPVPNLYKFAHQIGVGTLQHSVSVGLDAYTKLGAVRPEICQADDPCRLSLTIETYFIGASGNAQILSGIEYRFKTPFYAGQHSRSLQPVWQALANRMEGYASFEEFSRDVELSDLAERYRAFSGSPYNRRHYSDSEILSQVKEAQARALAQYARELKSFAIDPEIFGAIQELDAAKALLAAYVSVALPRAFEENDELRSFFRGNAGLVDQSQIVTAFQKNQSGLVNELAIRFDEVSTQRIDAFAKALSAVLRVSKESEGLPVVSEVLRQLILLKDAQTLAKPSTISVSEAMSKAQEGLRKFL